MGGLQTTTPFHFLEKAACNNIESLRRKFITRIWQW